MTGALITLGTMVVFFLIIVVLDEIGWRRERSSHK